MPLGEWRKKKAESRTASAGSKLATAGADDIRLGPEIQVERGEKWLRDLDWEEEGGVTRACCRGVLRVQAMAGAERASGRRARGEEKGREGPRVVKCCFGTVVRWSLLLVQRGAADGEAKPSPSWIRDRTKEVRAGTTAAWRGVLSVSPGSAPWSSPEAPLDRLAEGGAEGAAARERV